ncbi:hypothetical protein J4405_03215 [Candidatus Woesearchaeota archaeon]|nr:hypothetical protein [Candidatus Woesearchaeota archaeon]
MIDKNLLNELKNKGIIDKRDVLWWQLGFEGRRVYSQEEFDSTLQTVSFPYTLIPSPYNHAKVEEKKVAELKVWPKDNVPIIIKDVNMFGLTVPCFVSVKPMSHYESYNINGKQNGWDELEFARNSKKSISSSPLSIYHNPHIRGVVIEQQSDFLFWYPFIFGDRPVCYQTARFDLPEEPLPILVCPINPDKFYENLIRQWSHGRRVQKAAIKINNQEIVPYFEFNPTKNHFTIYPAPILEDKLDFPIVLRGKPTGIPEILGTGYVNSDDEDRRTWDVHYWELDPKIKRKVRNSLIQILGRLNQH